MDLNAIGQQIAKLGLPLLGAALPLPGGAAIGAALAGMIGGGSKPADILATLQQSADALARARQFELTHQETLLRIQVEAETATTQAINATMQAEAGSAHWPTYSWRPFLGFVGGSVILWDYCLAPWFKLPAQTVPDQVWLFLTAVLGVASYWRGRAQVVGNVDTRG